MEYINEFIKYKESKGEKAIYRVNDTRGYTYYSDDYVKWLEQQLRIHDVSGAVALLKFLKEEQQKQYADAKDYMTANQHQYYEEGCDAVLQLIEMRFGN